MGLYKDIDLGFNLDGKGDIQILNDVDAVNQGLRILLETHLGNRPGIENEYFGLSIKKYLFNELSFSIAETMGTEIGRQIRKFEPRINVEGINVDISEELDNNPVLT